METRAVLQPPCKSTGNSWLAVSIYECSSHTEGGTQLGPCSGLFRGSFSCRKLFPHRPFPGGLLLILSCQLQGRVFREPSLPCSWSNIPAQPSPFLPQHALASQQFRVMSLCIWLMSDCSLSCLQEDRPWVPLSSQYFTNTYHRVGPQ